MSLQKWKVAHSTPVSLISGKPEVHPKVFSGKNLLKNVTLQILNSIPVSLLIMFVFLYGVMLNFLCFFVLFIAVKTNSKINITPYGELFYHLFYRDTI